MFVPAIHVLQPARCLRIHWFAPYPLTVGCPGQSHPCPQVLPAMTLHPYHRFGFYASRLSAALTLVVLSISLFVEASDQRDLQVRVGVGAVWVLSGLFWSRMSSGGRLLTVASCLLTLIVLLAAAI